MKYIKDMCAGIGAIVLMALLFFQIACLVEDVQRGRKK